jgi:uncharacterized membrane protein YhaH (DUF805 family)
MSPFQILFSPAGRIRRRDYWLYSIGLFVAALALQYLVHSAIFGLPGKTLFADGAWMRGKTTPYALFAAAVFVVRQWPGFCIVAKRWHDRGRTAWIAVAYFVAANLSLWGQVAYSVRGAPQNVFMQALIGLPALGLLLWQFVECGCLDGTRGPNKYGPSPKGVDTNPAAVF